MEKKQSQPSSNESKKADASQVPENLFQDWNNGSKTVISISGGMDSTTLAYFAREVCSEVKLVSFEYGSKHNKYEREALSKISCCLGIPISRINLQSAFDGIKSNLLSTGGDIPHGHYERSNMSLTVVPGRNLVMASILAGIAESHEFDSVWLGTHDGDHAIYPDCRKEFVDLASDTVYASSDGRVRVHAPFIAMDKRSILKVGTDLQVPYQATRTCYSPQSVSCGKCGACVERLEAFEFCGIQDPLQYEDRSYYKTAPKGDAE